jgi:hypothetical protein
MLAQARVMGGDHAALDEYAGWLRTATQEDFELYPREIFTPLWQSPSHPAVERAAQALFGDPRSPLSDVLVNPDLLETSLVRLRAYRARVLSALASRTPAGKALVREQDVSYELGRHGGSVHVDRTDPHAPPAGTKLPLRVCDYVALRLSDLSGAPVFRLYWPEAMRDDALNAMAAFLRAQAGPAFTP